MSRALFGALGVAAVLGACGEKPQQVTGSTVKRSDTPAYGGVQAPYAATGWKAGDSASWEEQMRLRVQNQNEYTRVK